MEIFWAAKYVNNPFKILLGEKERKTKLERICKYVPWVVTVAQSPGKCLFPTYQPSIKTYECVLSVVTHAYNPSYLEGRD
jgi:hypothetical protein